ncbi:hypothetical protein MFS40622_1294 [Methanocaldococcus sp. FS406-22]|uniref:hypothetical protein n=1 Tax=Methanocaldococcus sp. (strain FS406-22) TaxID=644281 RepID=UPI0001BF2A5D|nr:hypothetical protein [Methanocaldococcus sp. FS406-22]ADC69971.1 hypothetical protein MFS40622_1294 [Methanocaldococcus sp. FS406-22]
MIRALKDVLKHSLKNLKIVGDDALYRAEPIRTVEPLKGGIMKLWCKGIFKIFALLAILCVVGSAFATSTSLSEASKKPVEVEKIDKKVKIYKNKIEINNLVGSTKIKSTISKDFSMMNVILSDDKYNLKKKYTIKVKKSKKGYIVFVYENNKLKEVKTTNINPIEIAAHRIILLSNSNLSEIQKSSIRSIIPVTPRANIELDLPSYIGHVGDSEYLTVSVEGRYNLLTMVFIGYYVRLPSGVEYTCGGENPTVIRLSAGESRKLPLKLGTVKGPCTILLWTAFDILGDGYSEIRKPVITYVNTGKKEISSKVVFNIIGDSYWYAWDTCTIYKYIK